MEDKLDLSGRIITAPVGQFCALSGLGRSKVYLMIADGTLKSFTVGRRRLIVLDSYRQLIEQQTQAKTVANG
jgi:excisionase family DNA binding protein